MKPIKNKIRDPNLISPDNLCYSTNRQYPIRNIAWVLFNDHLHERQLRNPLQERITNEIYKRSTS
jgi:hypothetical protein